MEMMGNLVGLSRDWKTDQVHIAFSIEDESVLREIEELKDSKLANTVKKYRKKRSLDANAYFHALVGKIADRLIISKAHAKNILISKYGQPQLLDDGSAMIYKTNAPVEYMHELETLHSIPVKFGVENGKEVVFYKIYRGSHTYDSKEMRDLIQGTVADAKELGIETLTPDELARMTALWGSKS